MCHFSESVYDDEGLRHDYVSLGSCVMRSMDMSCHGSSGGCNGKNGTQWLWLCVVWLFDKMGMW